MWEECPDQSCPVVWEECPDQSCPVVWEECPDQSCPVVWQRCPAGCVGCPGPQWRCLVVQEEQCHTLRLRSPNKNTKLRVSMALQ